MGVLIVGSGTGFPLPPEQVLAKLIVGRFRLGLEILVTSAVKAEIRI